MLEPQSRRLLLEALQPPINFRLDWAVGTTYSLDLTALLAAPVAFAFSDWQGRDGRPVLDPLALLKAVRQYANRICLFHQAGKIHVPNAYQPLLADLEDAIVPAEAPLGGNFHPKIWFLRYFGDDGSVIYRCLCLSRNMTFDRSWDTMLCLEGPLRDRANAFSRNHPLGRFAEELPGMAQQLLAPGWKKRIEQLAYDIRRVEFEVPAPFEDMSFHPLGIDSQPTWPFPQRMDRLLVVSPFADDRFAEDLAEYEIPIDLVSRAESLGCLKPSSLGCFEKLWTLDDTAEPEAADVEAPEEEQTADVELASAEGQAPIPLAGLHAKLYVADAGWNAHVWTGSANATNAAFRRNVEFLIELQGKKSRCGVAAVLGRTGSTSCRQATSLGDLLQPYAPDNGESAESEEERAFKHAADLLSRQVAKASPVARCIALADPDCFELTLHPSNPTKIKLPSGWYLQARPISLPDPHYAKVNLLGEQWVRFTSVSLLGLTAFFAFQVSSPDGRFQTTFVLKVPLENAPDHRNEHILRHLLGDRDRLMRFLLLLLMDHGARDFAGLLNGSAPKGGKGGTVVAMFDSTLLESLLRAIDREPERIDQVAEVIADLEKTPEGQSLLPTNLAAIWDPIWRTRQKQLLAAKKRPVPRN